MRLQPEAQWYQVIRVSSLYLLGMCRILFVCEV